MKYENFQTVTVDVKDAIATVTFDFGSVNVQGQEMLADLNSLAMRLERDRDTKVVIFQSANPEIWVCHYNTELLKDMSTEAVSRDEAQLLDLQSVCERISKVPQATIAKLEGFARGGGHELALALDIRFAARGKFKFMRMEVGMGILPYGGGASRMARQTGLGKAPSLSHWAGGLRAFGRTADEAMQILRTFKRYEDVGAIACEIECVAEDTLRLLNERTSIVTISLGSGNAGDVIFLFMADICGEAENPPRHAHAFRDLAPLHQQLHTERVTALKEFQSEVHASAFPYPAQSISMREGELEKLHEALEKVWLKAF